MQALILIVACIPAIAVLVGAYFKLVIRIRENDDLINHANDDLRGWVESEQSELRREEISIVLRGQREGWEPYLIRFQKDKARKHVLRRYEERLLSAERVVHKVKRSEFAPHASWRRLRDIPMPALTVPAEKAEVIERWKTPLTGPAMSTTEADVPPEKPIELINPYPTATAPFPMPDH
jgi:hypothetical protein